VVVVVDIAVVNAVVAAVVVVFVML